MGVIATFDFGLFESLFPVFFRAAPGFIPVTEDQINMVIPIATSYSRNDGGGPVNNPQVQLNLLNLAVAHCTQLLFGSATNPPTGMVGRIASASEGSVSVQTDWPTTPGSAWWSQTQYGAMWWQMALPYRLGMYLPKTTPSFNPYDFLV
jgi:hypothetical protein